MRVFHLPINDGSQASALVDGLRRRGVDASGFAYRQSPFDTYAGLRTVDQARSGNPWARRVDQATVYGWITRMITRADVVHWHSTPALPGGLDLALARKLGKRCVVEFHGSDIRQIAPDNPYLWSLWSDEPAMVSARNEAARQRQARFFGGDVDCVVSTPDLLAQVESSQFASVSLLGLAVEAPRVADAASSESSEPVKILHAPSDERMKGTDYVRRAFADLSDARVRGEIRTKVPRDEVLTHMGSCDIYLDQFVVGAYGVAAVEAMLLGKAVVCYLSDATRSELPGDCPVVPCIGEDLPACLRDLLDSPSRREELGGKSLAFAKHHHDPLAVVGRLMEVYQR